MVIEIVGSATFQQSLKCLAPGGRLVVVGNLETGIVQLNPGLVIVKELEILGAYATTQSELRNGPSSGVWCCRRSTDAIGIRTGPFFTHR